MKTVTSDKIKVVAIGLEIEEETWREKTKELPDFIHVLAKGDTLTELTRIYDIKATPTFYVLNVEKRIAAKPRGLQNRSEEHTSELQSRPHLVCRLLLEKKKKKISTII